MSKLKQKYLTDEHGKRVGIVLDIKEYRMMQDEIEELESIRAYDTALKSGDEAVSFEKAVDEIKHGRNEL